MTIKERNNTNKIKTISLFSGAGGLANHTGSLHLQPAAHHRGATWSSWHHRSTSTDCKDRSTAIADLNLRC